ncbi:hypothetical protein [Halomonas daqiaonensis]|uniref:Uncharacterized protein n=1 Tax=Halomonas daqiaonensis TaxID=650850 RepID=A0A1H7HKR8_9GAMM|nr:hypothetical protein [Halomonas daqiaonensis]SEK50708.1 hypothetical protein SAMN04488129_102240 [Halomonas daqiaonensis]
MKNLDNGNLTANQITALQELVADQGATGDAGVIKEKLRWIQKAPTPRAAWWRITNTLKVIARPTLAKHCLRRWRRP